jgi:hypothetical protein
VETIEYSITNTGATDTEHLRTVINAIKTIAGNNASWQTPSNMSDPLSVATSIAGIIGLAKEVTTILAQYISNVKSAHGDAARLQNELTAFCYVLDQLRGLLRTEELQGTCFNGTSVLVSVLGFASFHVQDLYKELDKLNAASDSKLTEFFERLKWPLRQEGYEKAVASLRQLAQYFDFSLNISNRLIYVYSKRILVR